MDYHFGILPSCHGSKCCISFFPSNFSARMLFSICCYWKVVCVAPLILQVQHQSTVKGVLPTSSNFLACFCLLHLRTRVWPEKMKLIFLNRPIVRRILNNLVVNIRQLTLGTMQWKYNFFMVRLNSMYYYM